MMNGKFLSLSQSPYVNILVIQKCLLSLPRIDNRNGTIIYLLDKILKLELSSFLASDLQADIGLSIGGLMVFDSSSQ